MFGNRQARSKALMLPAHYLHDRIAAVAPNPYAAQAGTARRELDAYLASAEVGLRTASQHHHHRPQQAPLRLLQHGQAAAPPAPPRYHHQHRALLCSAPSAAAALLPPATTAPRLPLQPVLNYYHDDAGLEATTTAQAADDLAMFDRYHSLLREVCEEYADDHPAPLAIEGDTAPADPPAAPASAREERLEQRPQQDEGDDGPAMQQASDVRRRLAMHASRLANRQKPSTTAA